MNATQRQYDYGNSHSHSHHQAHPHHYAVPSHEHDDGGREEDGPRPPSPPRERRRLQLTPRSAQGVAQAQATRKKSSSNPFGAARPREEVLAGKGIDAKLIDARIQKKAAPVRLSKDQEAEVEALRSSLEDVEEKWRDANEKELPEEKYRVEAEAKRKELNELIAKFHALNAEDAAAAEVVNPASRTARRPNNGGGGGVGYGGDRNGGPGAGYGGDRGGGHDARRGSGGAPQQNGRKFERPSERRRRLEQERMAGGGGGGGSDRRLGGDGAYSSFGGRYNNNSEGRNAREDLY